METRVFSAYNLARGVLLNSKLVVPDSGNHPLKLLDIVISGMGMDSTAGLWLNPLHTIPAVPRVFPFDLIYLDKEYRVLDIAEMGPGIDFPPLHAEVASALILPSDTLRRSQTASGDRLIVCLANNLEALLAASGASQPASIQKAGQGPAAVGHPATDRPPSSIIELTPERPLVPASAPSTGIEHSVLTAVAKATQTPAATAGGVALVEAPALPPHTQAESKKDPEEPEKRESRSPGASMDITGTVFERPRKVQAAIIEHHVDPEDLFSNWVVSPPAPSVERPAAPPASAIQKSAPPARNGKQNGTKAPASAKTSVEQSGSPRAATPDSAPAAVQPKTKTSSEKPAIASKPKTAPQEKPQTPTPPRVGIPQLTPASTFTAIPYGMWQVSIPTAVAPVAAPNPFSSKPASSAPSARQGTKQAESVSASAPAKPALSAGQPPEQPAFPPKALKPEGDRQVEQRSFGSESQSLVPAAPITRFQSEKPESVFKSSPADRKREETLAPGDFLASLQQKLERVQQSKPAAPPPPEPQAAAPLATIPAPLSPAGIPASAQEAKARQTPATPPKLSTQAAPLPVQSATYGPGVRTEPALSPTQAKIKTEPSPGSLRSRFKHWLNPVATPSDRRKTSRRYVPGVVAHYFTGGGPKPKDVADISMSGMYLLTDDRWMPGTMIQMTLQKPCARGERKQSINVLSRIVRRGSDGVAIEFIMPEGLSHIGHDIQPSQATDKFALARFL
jgi:hypothetical protein